MFCKKLLGIFVLALLCYHTVAADNGNPSLLSVACKQYIDSLPLSRSTSFGEEQIVNGNYQGLGQQYNNLTGTIKSVVFSARSNPSSMNITSSVKVVIYNANLGLPGTILSTSNITIDSSSSNSFYEAILPSPINVNGNIIIALEPLIPANDNFFVQRNTPPDGQNLNLIKIKQANQWFKNLAAGDPSFDFDFMIFPMKEIVINPDFNFSSNLLNVTFNNTSSNTTSNFEWDFGDGNTSTLVSPTHQYANAGLYQVKLKMISNGYQFCNDSIVKPVQVSSVGLNENENQTALSWKYNDNGLIIFQSNEDCLAQIYNASGEKISKLSLKSRTEVNVNCVSWESGIYIITTDKGYRVKFFKF